MPEAFKLMAMNPRNQLVPLRVDDKGRLELVQVQSGDEDAPAITATVVVSTMPSLTVGAMPALTGALTTNPTRPTLLYEGLLSGADATLYTAAANWRAIEIYLVNVDTAARTATLYHGNPGADANCIGKTIAVEVGGRVPVFMPALANTEKINGLCDSANKVKIEIWGIAA
jgi:hypothetical protein